MKIFQKLNLLSEKDFTGNRDVFVAHWRTG